MESYNLPETSQYYIQSTAPVRIRPMDYTIYSRGQAYDIWWGIQRAVKKGWRDTTLLEKIDGFTTAGCQRDRAYLLVSWHYCDSCGELGRKPTVTLPTPHGCRNFCKSKCLGKHLSTQD